MSKLIDLTGERFGRLTVIERAESNKYGAIWKCSCDCGNRVSVAGVKLRNGHTRSCGCLVSDTIGNLNKTHGMSHTRLHYIWGNMKSRCYNPNNHFYKRYGGRGITVCDEWIDDFTAFVDWALSSGYDESLTIDRIDNDQSYFPDNCRWANKTEQANNRKSSRLFEMGGEIKSISEWCREYKKKSPTVAYRLRQNWTIEEALDLTSRNK